MKLTCSHGYFRFDEMIAGEVSHFASLFGFAMARVSDYFTFSALAAAPTYSLPGKLYLNVPATKAFEGRPWEVMRANGLVYDFSRRLVVPIATVTASAQLELAGNFYITTGMILPGTIMDGGKRVKDYAAHFSFDRMNFRYSEIGYE